MRNEPQHTSACALCWGSFVPQPTSSFMLFEAQRQRNRAPARNARRVPNSTAVWRCGSRRGYKASTPPCLSSLGPFCTHSPSVAHTGFTDALGKAFWSRWQERPNTFRSGFTTTHEDSPIGNRPQLGPTQVIESDPCRTRTTSQPERISRSKIIWLYTMSASRVEVLCVPESSSRREKAAVRIVWKVLHVPLRWKTWLFASQGG